MWIRSLHILDWKNRSLSKELEYSQTPVRMLVDMYWAKNLLLICWGSFYIIFKQKNGEGIQFNEWTQSWKLKDIIIEAEDFRE